MTLDLEQIYRDNYRRVYHLCLRMLRNEADAEDLAQEVFIQVGKTLHLYRGDAAFTTWLHRVAVNKVLMFMRTRKRSRQTIQPINTEDFESFADYKTSHSYLPTFDEKIDIAEALKLLPKGYHKYFLMHDVLGLYHEEIAVITGDSVGTSKSQLYKARRKMKKLLEKKANPRIAHAVI